jgi:putative endonuclease
MNYVYVLLSEVDNQFYTGATTDLKSRLQKHDGGQVPSTRKRRPLKLIYYEACISKEDTFRREKYLKTGMGKRFLRSRLRNSLEEL